MAMRRLTKQQMIAELRKVIEMGWVKSRRPLNSGGIGNTIDHLLGFPENNFPVADTAQWELKSHRYGSSALVTLLHCEPEPRSARIVPRLLLPMYGWPDRAGRPDELSFRQTLRTTQFSDRGFIIAVDRNAERITVAFVAAQVGEHHADWLQSVEARIGLGPLEPQPYWSIQELALKVSTKMLNSFLVVADTRKAAGHEMFRIRSILTLQGFSFDRFVAAVEQGTVFVDFDARTHHNHGTKFRIHERDLPALYRYVDQVA